MDPPQRYCQDSNTRNRTHSAQVIISLASSSSSSYQWEYSQGYLSPQHVRTHTANEPRLPEDEERPNDSNYWTGRPQNARAKRSHQCYATKNIDQHYQQSITLASGGVDVFTKEPPQKKRVIFCHPPLLFRTMVVRPRLVTFDICRSRTRQKKTKINNHVRPLVRTIIKPTMNFAPKKNEGVKSDNKARETYAHARRYRVAIFFCQLNTRVGKKR